MKIRNINTTAKHTCSCGSWLRHWEKFGRQSTGFCQVHGCFRRDVVGAHVQKADDSDDRCYIYPLCPEHNSHEGTLSVSDAYNLVPADTCETCDKKTP